MATCRARQRWLAGKQWVNPPPTPSDQKQLREHCPTGIYNIAGAQTEGIRDKPNGTHERDTFASDRARYTKSFNLISPRPAESSDSDAALAFTDPGLFCRQAERVFSIYSPLATTHPTRVDVLQCIPQMLTSIMLFDDMGYHKTQIELPATLCVCGQHAAKVVQRLVERSPDLKGND